MPMATSARPAAMRLRSVMLSVSRPRDSSTNCSSAAATPNALHRPRYAAMKRAFFRKPATRPTAGAAPGSIIAAIIATHMPSASCGSLVIFIMAAHPGLRISFRLVAPFRHDVEVLVVDAERIDAARVGRVGAEQLALRVLEEHAHALALFNEGILLDEVVERLLALHFRGREGDVEVEVEVAARGREPLEAPAHALVISGEIGIRRPGNRDHGDVAVVEVDDRAVEAVGPARAARAAGVPARAEHEVIDDELAAPVEQLGERLPAVAPFELIGLFHRLPRQRAPRCRELVAAARERLFLRQQLPARGEPFLGGYDRVTLCHRASLTCKYLLAYYHDHGHGQGIQGTRGPEPAQAPRPPLCDQRPDARRARRAPRHDAPGGDAAPRPAGRGEPRRHLLARAREAPLPQPRAALRDL